MIVNLIGGIHEYETPHRFNSYNAVVSYFLNKALRDLGVETNLVVYDDIYKHDPPPCDHTLVIVGSAFVEFDTMRATQRSHIFGTKERRQVAKEFCDRIYNSTRGKTTLLIDSNFSYWDRYFDIVFTVATPTFPLDPTSEDFLRRYGKESENKYFLYPEKYIYAGWGADSDYCYPGKNEQKTIFVDGYETSTKYYNQCKKWYTIIDRVLKSLTDAKTHRIYDYSQGKRNPWPIFQRMLRESHFYIDPQLGATGLTRIEAATCGCLIVSAKEMYGAWALDPLETACWETEDELREILARETKPQRIHERARVQTWNKVAKRIIAGLNQ